MQTPIERRPDFSGEWTLNATRSSLELEPLRQLESATLRIEHNDPNFSLWRRFVLNGQEHTVQLALISDGQAVESLVGDQRRITCLTWADDALVFTTLMHGRDGTSLNAVQYSIEDHGRTLRALERFRGPTLSYDNSWVFERR